MNHDMIHSFQSTPVRKNGERLEKKSTQGFGEADMQLAQFTLLSIVGHTWHRLVLPFQARQFPFRLPTTRSQHV
jgi:hypothetical protein